MSEPPAPPGVPARPTNVPPPPAGEPVRRRPRRWPSVVAAAVIIAIVGVVAWWLMATTVPERRYDEATAELAMAEADVTDLEQQVSSLEEQLASAEADNRDLTTDRTALRAEVTRLNEEAAALRDATALALVAAEAQAHDVLNTGIDLSAQLDAAGADFSDADALLADLGHEATFKEWTARDEAFFATDRAMNAVDDDRLWDAWQRWYGAEPGSPQEQAAYFEYLWRLHRLVVEALGDTQQ